MEAEKIKILIVGHGAVASALAGKLKQYDYVEKIFATGGLSSDTEIIDFREDDLTGLLMFALENKINLTIPVSEKALEADIVSFFQSNGQNIFGPTKDSCEFVLNKILCKKFLYKIHAKTPKFGMYNKISQITDYLKNSSFPIILQTAQNSYMEDDKMVCPTLKSACNYLDKLFLKGETDVLIEEFTYGHNFTVYFITDGYSAIPLNIVGNYKFLKQNGGQYTDGAGCYCPDYKIDETIKNKIRNIISDILQNLDSRGCPYTGIIGIECVLTDENHFVVSDVKPFLQNHDSRAVLNLCEDDLIKIFNSCINGFFSDEYDSIKINDYASVSLTVYFDKENKELDFADSQDIDFIEAIKKDDKNYSVIGANFTVTKTASTLTRTKKYLSDELEELNIPEMKYRKDICANIKQ